MNSKPTEISSNVGTDNKGGNDNVKQEIKCGICGNGNIDYDMKYLSTSQCCNQVFRFHFRCARKILSQKDKKFKNSMMMFDPDMFKKMVPSFHCVFCKQKNCFYCGRQHNTAVYEKCGKCNKIWCHILQPNPNANCSSALPDKEIKFCLECKPTEKSSSQAKEASKSKKGKNDDKESSENDDKDSAGNVLKISVKDGKMSVTKKGNKRNRRSKKKTKLRYENPEPPTTIFKPIPDHRKLLFCQLMEDTFGIDKKRVNDNFASSSDVGIFLKKKFVALDPKVNLFSLNLTKSSDLLYSQSCDLPECDFDLSLNDILTLTERQKISPKVINFCFECFNLYNAYNDEDEKKSIPGQFFVNVPHEDRIAVNPDSRLYPMLYHHIKNYYIVENIEDYAEDEIPMDIESWYVGDMKPEATDVLDFYDKNKVDMTEFITVVAIGESYITVKVMMEENKLQLIVPMEFSDEELHKIYKEKVHKAGILYSKYFGLYLKEKNDTINGKEDYCGHDIKESKFSNSLIRMEYDDECIISVNECESGVSCIDKCIDFLKQQKTPNVQLDKKSELDLELTRLCMMRLIVGVYNLFNGNKYEMVEDHVKMKYGRMEPDQIKFFRQIHEYFDAGKIPLSLDKKNLSHANTVYKKYFKNQKTFFNMYSDKESTASSNTPDTTNSPSPVKRKKKKLVVGSTRNKPPKKVFLENKITTIYEDDTRDEGYLPDNLPIHEVATQHNTSNPVYDVTCKKTFLWHKKSARNNDPHKDSLVRYPEQFANEIFKLLMNMFNPENEEDRMDLDGIIKSCMSQFEIHFVMDVMDDELNYEIQAAVVIDPMRELRSNKGEKYSKYGIIHCIGIKDGIDNPNYLDKLLDNLIHSRNIFKRGIFMVTTFGGHQYRDHDALLKYVKNQAYQDEAGIWFNMTDDDYLPQHSLTHFGMGGDIYFKLEENTFANMSMRFLQINCDVFLFARFNGERFQLYSHPFGWTDASTRTEMYLNDSIKKDCKKKENHKFKLKLLGHRKANDDSSTNKSDIVCDLDEKFRQTTYNDLCGCENNCAWLCLAAMINNYDEEAADRMIVNMKMNITDYNWMYMISLPKSVKKDSGKKTAKNIVGQKLKEGIGYTLSKISGHQITSKGFTEYLFREAQGCHVVGLESKTGGRTHCIGIDCDEGLIYDCMDSHVFRLNETTLNKCVGEDQIGVEKTWICYKVVREKQKLDKNQQPKMNDNRRKNRKRKSSAI